MKELVHVHRAATWISEILIRNQLALIEDELLCHSKAKGVLLSPSCAAAAAGHTLLATTPTWFNRLNS